MIKLEELIQRYCPDGVKYKPLGKICNIKGRIGFRGYTRDDQVKEGEGALSLSPSNIQGGQMDYTKGTYITWAKYEESPEIKTYNGDIILCKTASVGKVALVKDLPYKATINPQLVVLKDIKCSAPFLTYALGTNEVQRKIISMAGVGSVPNIPQKALAEIEIPIPPLPVQEEIVRILDAFEELQAELQAELQKRKQQYNYYRDNLLSFEGRTDVQWKKLGDVAYYVKNRVNDSLITISNYVSVENLLQNRQGKTNASNVPDGSLIHYESGDILIGNIRPYLKKIWLADGDGGTNGDVLTIRANRELLTPEFLYQCLASDDFFQYDMNHAKGAKMPRGSKEDVLNYMIPITSLAEQQRIASILDRFDRLTNDLTSGLPAEIEKRRQQYEYYRDKLLTFKRKGA